MFKLTVNFVLKKILILVKSIRESRKYKKTGLTLIGSFKNGAAFFSSNFPSNLL